MTPDVLVVIPAYNESASVGAVVAGLADAGLACVVVDDGSADATAATARAAGAPVLRLPVNLGVGGALRCGFRYAVEHGYRRVVQCDADGQHPPSEIRHLLEVQESTGAHLVVGSRFVDGAPAYDVGRARRIIMRALSGIVRRRTGTVLHDPTSGFRCIAQPLLGEFATSYPVHYLGDTFEAALVAARSGYRIVEAPVQMLPRQGGAASAGPLAAVRFIARSVVAALAGLTFRIRPLAETQP
ncbi:MAG: glycosyltransferase family 2 protein [Actinobacteria bacterium]|nr:glycosyltransferase family 2 protein [Actinomycetota bacterium]